MFFFQPYLILNVEYCEMKFAGTTIDKLKRDLTSKCGEERRKLLKETVVNLNNKLLIAHILYLHDVYIHIG